MNLGDFAIAVMLITCLIGFVLAALVFIPLGIALGIKYVIRGFKP